MCKMLNTLLAAALQTCVIVYSPGSNGDWLEKYWHEMAHCVEPDWHGANRHSFTGKANQVPKRLLYKLYDGPLYSPCGDKPCRVEKAKKLCGGAFGCQWYQE